MTHKVMQNCNLSERNFSLSLARGEIRSDLGGKFSKTYLAWHCEEGILKDITNSNENEEVKEPLTENGEVKEPLTEADIEEELEGTEDLEDELEEEELEEDEEAEDFPDFDEMSVKQIRAYAKSNSVNIDGLTRKNDMIDAIIDALADSE